VDTTVAAVRSEILLSYANSMVANQDGVGVYPVELDGQADGPCATCFAKIMDPPVDNTHWSKQGNTYTYTSREKTRQFVYNPTDGTFVEKK
jgi:hypothetical protein